MLTTLKAIIVAHDALLNRLENLVLLLFALLIFYITTNNIWHDIGKPQVIVIYLVQNIIHVQYNI